MQNLGTKIRTEYKKILKFGPKYKILGCKKIKNKTRLDVTRLAGCLTWLDV